MTLDNYAQCLISGKNESFNATIGGIFLRKPGEEKKMGNFDDIWKHPLKSCLAGGKIKKICKEDVSCTII